MPALAENLGVTVDELLAGERRPKTPEVGEQTRKYIEERKRKQYKIAVMLSALVLVIVIPYCLSGFYIFWDSTPYLLVMALSIGGYIAANIWMPGQETLRQRKAFCAVWLTTLSALTAYGLSECVDYILYDLRLRRKLADYLAKRYCEKHDLIAWSAYQEFYDHYKTEISQWTDEHFWVLWLAGIAIMIVLGLLVGHITWKLQHGERKKHESES